MKLRLAAASMAFALAASGAAQAGSLSDGDFTTPNEHGSWGEPTALPGWVSNSGDEFEVGNSGVYGLPCVTPGCQNLEVNANKFDSDSLTLSGLKQGDSYTLSWLYGARNGGGPQELDISADGTQFLTDTDAAPGTWTPNSYTFVADATGSELFTFASVNVGGLPSYGNELTGFSLSVPEPATWAMMLLGLGMIGGGLRLSRRNSDMSLTAA
jgi:hypothetical protein